MGKNLFSAFKNLFIKSFDDELTDSRKNIVRAEVKAKKQNITDAYKTEQANAVYAKIEQMPEFKEAKTVLMYWSVSDELPTHPFIKKWSIAKTILLPVVKGQQMTIRPFVSEEMLAQGDFKIMEPMSGNDYLKTVDLVIVPGVAFDRKKKRIGRGKGYYDKYFKNKRIKKWGIGFDFQLYESLPSASYDIDMDRIITPSETIW
ncbi:5-formyltetrahydrofolate cyclo-ligase [bioreactor metagenome]|jgi:5-formyltetrahydrofolate cyclo-ligase|uniref:5-formyltetrahydrofolate cyclo-ligase n=1 Tax=bioreactor metagenome TaxID=1076179 RepID=A0A644UYQ9_9ZZZZ|nr:5-formyltetrahydrofolate cyclo-ligase [Paludibacter sp.]